MLSMYSSMSLLIFDFDGTMFDSMPHIHRGLTNVFTRCGLPVPSVQEFLIHLRPPYTSFYKKRGVTLSDEEIDRLFLEKANEPGATLFPDAVPTIIRLAAQGHVLAIVSGNYRTRVEQVLTDAGIIRHFSGIRGECESKTAAISAVIHELGFSKADALMIGDSVLDIEHATSISVRSVGIIRYPGLKDMSKHLIEAGATSCINALSELDEHISQAFP